MIAVVAVCVLTVLLSGCDADNVNERGGGRAYLRGGHKVPSNLSGWIAVPGAEPKPTQDKNTGITFAVLKTHDVVPSTMNSWGAMTPQLFLAASGITVEAVKDDSSELYVLNQGSQIPYEMSNWIALRNTQPEVQISATKKEKGVGTLYTENIVPKEMNGWVAMDRETFAKLLEKYMMTGKGSKTSKE